MHWRHLRISKRTRTLAALLAVLTLLSSCIKYEGVITIQDDGSGTVEVLTALDPEAFALFEDFGGTGGGGTDEICDDFSSDLNSPGEVPAGATVEPYNEDGLCGARLTYPLAASLDHSDDLADALDDSTRIYKQGDNWFFETNFDASEVTGEAELAGGDEIVNDLFGDAEFTIVVDLPGRAVVGENNATNVGDDGRFTWDIDLLNPPDRLFAQTEPGSGGGTGGGGGGISPIIIGVIVAALAAAAAFYFLKIRGGGDTTTGASGPTNPMGDVSASMPGPLPTPGSAPAPGAMPVGDGPMIDAAPPGAMPQAAPVRPDPADVKETVVMNAADLQAAAAEAAGDAAPPTPEYDEALGAWVVNDPQRGRLRHDPETDTWSPVD